MHEVDLDITGAGMSKLRNGHACRCSLAKGEGVKAFMKEDNIKKMLKNARKGMKATVKLDREEIDHNRMHGSGLMVGGKFSLKHAAKNAHVGRKLGNLAKKAAPYAAAELSADMFGPETAPFAYEMTNAAVGGSVKRKVIDLIEDIGENAPRKKGISRVRQAVDLVERMRKPKGGKIHVKKALHSIAHSKPAQALKKKAIDKGGDMIKKQLVEHGVPPALANMAVKHGTKAADKATGGKIHVKKALHHIAHSKPVQALKKKALDKGGEIIKQQLVDHGVPAPLANLAVKHGTKAADKATGGAVTTRSSSRAAAKSAPANIDWGSDDESEEETAPQKAPPKRRRKKNPNVTPSCSNAGSTLAKCSKVRGGSAGPDSYTYGSGAGPNAYAYGGSAGPNAVAYGGSAGPNARMYGGSSGPSGGSIGGPEPAITNVGAGGTFISQRNPALRSQPMGAHWYFATQFPPAYANMILNSKT